MRLENQGTHSINFVNHQGAEKKGKKHGKGQQKQLNVNESSSQVRKKRNKNGKCHFCEKSGHFQKDCLKRKAWFEKKGKPSAFTCLESNLTEVPYNSWWIDSYCTVHISNTMQGFLTIRTINKNERFVYMGNRVKAPDEVVGTYRLILDTGRHLDLVETYYVPSLSRDLVSLISSKAVPKTPFELWTGKKPSLRHLYVWSCPTEVRVYNPQEKNLDLRTINDFFIGYPKKSKGYRFYCPNYSMRIVETENARFIENGEVSGSEEPRNVEIKEVRVRIPLSCTSFKFIAPEAVVQQSNQQEQQINVPINHNEAIIDEPIVDEPQEVASRRSQRQKKSASSDDYLVYLHESETDLEIDDDPISFSQAIESNSSDK
ncbi:hypothetical protein FXO38_02351 [Capsicum annuum]|nr:hypothetical protein FXO38_02351 [Capsicum annuum]